MNSTSIDEALTEEREELMVSSLNEPNNPPIIKKSHFLKPLITTTIDESEAKLRPSSSPDIKPSPFSVSFCGWRLPNKNFKLWAEKMSTLHKPTWIKAGIFEAVESSTYRIYKNQSLILSLAQKWCLDTKTFVFPWGEATITLEDVNVLLGFSISGSSVFASLESSEMRETVEKLEKQRLESTKQVSWISRFVNDELEHEAFLVLWLSNFVFPDQPNRSISRNVFPIAVRLARGEKIALAPAVLAALYKDLGLISALASTQNVYTNSLFKLVQVWIWERFKSVRPEAEIIPRGKPRIAQWSCLKQRNEGLILLDGFDWRPYTKPLKNWNPTRFYGEWITIHDSLDDEFVSFARCVRVSKLVGIGIVEDYYPNRVAMQFGFAQDIPVLCTTRRNHFTEKEAWDDYNRSLSGLKLYIPSRLATASVTARYRDWWIGSVSEIQKETFNAINTVDHYDENDASLKVVPLSQVLEKLGDGTNNGHKRARDCRETQIEEEDDGNITIAQIMKSRKKCSDDDDVEKTHGGESSRLEGDKSTMKCFQTQIEENELAKTEGEESSRLEGDKSAMECFLTQIEEDELAKTEDELAKTEGEEESSRLETDYKNVSVVLPQNLASRDETVATTKSVVASNGVVSEKKEEEDERLKQRVAAIEELALKLEERMLKERMLKVENILAKIKQWKITSLNHLL